MEKHTHVHGHTHIHFMQKSFKISLYGFSVAFCLKIGALYILTIFWVKSHSAKTNVFDAYKRNDKTLIQGQSCKVKYRENPKNLDIRKICCNHLEFEQRGFIIRVIMLLKDADGIANSVDPDQTALIWVCTVCPGLSVRKLRIIMVKSAKAGDYF